MFGAGKLGGDHPGGRVASLWLMGHFRGVQCCLASFCLSYAGHGAGARFLDGQAVLRLSCRAVALLFGCSSAALAVHGNLEGAGIVLKYIMAGW